MAGVRERNESAWLLPNDGTRTNHRLRNDMRRFADSDAVDLVVVGCGAGGSVLIQRLARRGWRVAGLEAGPFWDPDADWVSDEAGSHHLYWTEPRVISGTDPVPLGSNNSGRGVGGSMVHYAGYTPRFHPSDFATAAIDGVGADWPLRYADLRPYYADIEAELPVAGEDWPWGDPHGYPQRPHPVGGNGEVFLRGARAAGITARVGPVAISNGRFGNRPHCIYRGFCLQGCKVNAKASPLITHIPDALAHGAEIRADAMVTGIGFDERTGRATGVHYVRGGVPRFQRAAAVAVAGYSIETPRLLLNSTSRRFPDGLCNDFDQVGRYVMVQGAPQTAGRFDAEVRMYKAPPPEVSSEQFYETDPARPYKRGFSLQNVSPLPITWAEHVAAQGHWGASLRQYMSDYVHWSCLGALCEFLPQPDNRVTLDAIARAAEILNAGRKVAILAGAGARGAQAELEQVAEILGAGVAKPLLGKDVLSDELPYVTGSIGLLGTRPSYELMDNCDTLLTVGSSFPYTQFLPAFDQARAVQIDIDGKYIGMRYPYELNLVGDARATLQALIPLLERKENRSWREDIEANVARWWETMEQEAMVEADPVNPMRLFHEASTRLPGNAIVTADSGSSANWYARQLKFRGDIRGSLSGNLATMGPGVPYGIGAKFGHPDRPVIVFAGDGAMQMNGLAELITIKHYWERWTDPRLIVAVLHNDDLNQVTWEMRAMEGAPKFTESQTLPDVDYAAFAASLGLLGINVDKPDDLGPAWDRALAAGRPALLDVRVDPSIPPIPPHTTFEQAKNTARAILEGDENARSVIVEGIKTKMREFLPHNRD